MSKEYFGCYYIIGYIAIMTKVDFTHFYLIIVLSAFYFVAVFVNITVFLYDLHRLACDLCCLTNNHYE
jgi:hypothetical protein